MNRLKLTHKSYFIKRDNEDRQGADIKFKFSWIFCDKSGGEGLGTPDLFPPPLPPSTSNPWVNLLHVFDQNSFNEGIAYYYYLRIKIS